MLYHCRGISFSLRLIRVSSIVSSFLFIETTHRVVSTAPKDPEI
jgi:hypothetical protein